MTFKLEQLGPFRVEQTEDYKVKFHDNSYGEMIRIRGSKYNPPVFAVPSHVFKFSESELGLYLCDHKNLWRSLGNLLRIHIDISDQELIVRFPITKFHEVNQIVRFIRKRGQHDLKGAEKELRRCRFKSTRLTPRKIEEKASKSNESVHEGNLIQLNIMNSKEGPR